MENAKPYGTVLIKASVILDFLANKKQASLQEISRGTEMTPSTTLKILDTLALIGYVQKNQDKTYHLGQKLIRYANQNLDQVALVEVTRPYLEKLNEQLDETVHLGILVDDEILYVNKLEPKGQTILMTSKIGITRPLYSSAMGKAVLAMLPASDYENYLAKTELTPHTPHTITNSLMLAEEMTKVRESQVAYDDEEMEKDIFCIGASIMENDQIIGAFSVSMPKYRVSESFEKQVIDAVKVTKKAIEDKLVESK